MTLPNTRNTPVPTSRIVSRVHGSNRLDRANTIEPRMASGTVKAGNCPILPAVTMEATNTPRPLWPIARVRLALLLESRLEQADLALDRIVAIGATGRCVHRGIEPTHRPVQRFGALDQRPQAFGQELDVLLVVVLGGCELYLGLFLIGLSERHLAFLDRAMEQEPRRELHQARGEPHAFGGVSERGVAGKSLRFLPAWTVEISRGLLHERHPVAEQIGEGL